MEELNAMDAITIFAFLSICVYLLDGLRPRNDKELKGGRKDERDGWD